MAFDATGEIELGWSARNEYWLSQNQRSSKPRGLRERRKEPLILSGHGVHLRVDKATLYIRNGFTHYPQDQETFRFFRGDLNLPTRIIMLDGSGGISFDVLAWLSQQGVTLIQLDWHGDVVTVIGGAGYAGDAAKIAWQVQTRDDNRLRMAFSTDLIIRKIGAAVKTLETSFPPTLRRDNAIIKGREGVKRLRSAPPADMTALRLTEAVCASAYFAAWRGIELEWKSTTKYPIPEEWRTFASRASLANGAKLKNVKATHPLNALLNYAYGVLRSRLQIEAVANGFDPTIGIMHHGRRDAPAYIFDIMEPERPKVDVAVLKFALSETLTGADFLIGDDGTCRLSPQLARRVASLTAN